VFLSVRESKFSRPAQMFQGNYIISHISSPFNRQFSFLNSLGPTCYAANGDTMNISDNNELLLWAMHAGLTRDEVRHGDTNHRESSPFNPLKAPPNQFRIYLSKMVLGMSQTEEQFAHSSLTCPGMRLFWL
jgi:hypothetical protein